MSAVLDTPTLDAQMSDYLAPGDSDVLMQTHSTDTWTAQDDGRMVEDSSFSMLTAKNPDSATTGMFMSATTDGTDHQNEVEMEDYEHHSEYEMLDESEAIVEDDDHSHDTIQEEIVDVEVVDLQPSPETSLTMAAPPALEPHTEDIVPQHSPLPPPPLTIVSEVINDGLPAEAAVIAELPATENAASETVTLVKGDSGEVQAAGSEPNLEDHATHGSHDAHSEVEHPESHAQEPLATLANTGILSEVDTAPSNVAASEPHVASETQYEAEVDAALDETGVGDPDEVGSNPHEIADGVFIEPVPAVIVQASFSDQPLVLFNRPPVSRPHSPSPDDDLPSDVAVLLRDRPTLYYGPLSDLFKALREEEVFTQQGDLHHTELGFSIETLELSITEDNVHAKEFSLFQLNTLHDAFHSGSLRVTLLQQAPRFIARYHELQEHLDHSGLPSNEDAVLTAVHSSTGEDLAEQREVEHEVHADHSPDFLEQRATHPEEVPLPEDTDTEHQVQNEQQEAEPAAHHSVGDENHEGQRLNKTIQEATSHVLEEHTEIETTLKTAGQPEENSVEPHEGFLPVQNAGASAQGSEVSAREDYQPSDGQPERNASPFEQPGENAEVAPEGGEVEDERDEYEVEHVTVEEGAVEEVEHPAEAEENREHEGGDEYGEEAQEHLEEEYDPEGDADQVDADELQEDLGTGEDSEHSGEVVLEDETRDDVEVGTQEAQEHVDERSPSPGAEDELPPIDTDLFKAVDVEEDFTTSASTQDGWPGEPYDGDDAAVEAQDEETLHSNSEEGDDDANHYIDEHSLLHQEGEDDAEWDQDVDAEAEPSWEDEFGEYEEQPTDNGEVSVRPKRGFHEVDGDEGEDSLELGPTSSPGSKRSRIE